MRRHTFLTAAVAALLAVLLVSCGGSEADFNTAIDEEPSGASGARDDRAADSVTSSGSGGALSDRTDSDSGFTTQAAFADRKIIFTANVVLESEDVQATFLAVEQAARAAAGYVENSSIGSFRGGDGDRYASASITIRVPTERYDSTINSLRTLPGITVESEDASSTEVTEEYTDLESRLRNLERSESQYLSLLDGAESIQDILIVNERIDSVRLQIEQIEGRLRLLDDLTDLATISISIHAPENGPVAASDGPKSFRNSFADAWDSAQTAGQHLLAAGAVVTVAAIWLAIPVLVVGGFALLIAKKQSGRTPTARQLEEATAEQGEATQDVSTT